MPTLAAQSAEPWITGPKAFDDFIRGDAARMRELANRAGIVPE